MSIMGCELFSMEGVPMTDHDFVPARPGSILPHAGTYRRVLPVTLERLYENALDWEHLPHLHHGSFTSVRCLDAGASAWRAAVTHGNGRDAVIELSLDRDCRRWVTRAVEGFGAGSEIWTHAFPLARGRVEILVDFFLPEVDEARRARLGRSYADYYARLYDEDVAMMTERQHQLDRRIDRARNDDRTLVLGQPDALVLPMDIVLGGREFVLAEVEGALAAFPRQCPHQLGPLSADGLEGRVVICPWHGDRFDVVSGANLSGRGCRLLHLPEIRVDQRGCVTLTASH
jgi:nitrite reductase/ring-hydroxylating ferredoxin subunit